MNQAIANPYNGPLKGDNAFAQVTDNVARIMEAPKPPLAWYISFAFAQVLLLIFGASLGWVVWEGIGAWGHVHPVAWGFPIVNFVFWVGIGHAGTLISAILFLLRQNWRTAINRFADCGIVVQANGGLRIDWETMGQLPTIRVMPTG